MFSSFFLLTCLSSIFLVARESMASVPLPIPIDPTLSGSYTMPPNLTIDMPIDHFDHGDTRTYKNRYWINDVYYQEGGPIFFQDIGEGTVDQQAIIGTLGENGTLMAPLRLAEQFNGMAVLWEHRFYGESLPFPLDKETGLAAAGYDAYKYLNNEQALEDVVYFANNFQPPGYEGTTHLLPTEAPWIWIGGSYSGARGAMIRLRNPEVFYAIWASSAPVEAQVDMSVYYNPIQQSMPTNCSADVHAAIAYVDKIFLRGTVEEVETVKRAIFLASVGDAYSDISNIDPADAGEFDYYSMAQNLSYAFISTRRAFQYYNYAGSLGQFCDDLESWNPENTTQFDIHTKGTEWLKNTADRRFTNGGIAATLGAKQAFYAFLSATFSQRLGDLQVEPSRTSPGDNMSWNWQFCSEFGYFQDANASDPTSLISRFGNVTAFARHQCKDVFEYAPDLPAVDAILKYGGYSMTPSNTMFTNGENDPWRTLGVQADKKINPSAIIRDSTTDIPACNTSPEGKKVFGQVYPGQVHTADLSELSAEGASGDATPSDSGFDLFSTALGQWLECFGR